MAYSTFDAASFADDSATERAIQKSVAPTQATQAMANQASAIIKRFPTISKGSLVGAVKLGISDNDPRLGQIVLKESLAKEQNGFSKLREAISVKEKAKSASRGLFLGFQNLWEAGLPRGARYLEGRQQGMTHDEAKDKSKASLLDMKAQAEAAGKEVDLGTGWFLGSTDPTQTDEYKNMLAAGVDPLVAREFVLDNVLGVQIYEQQRKKAEEAIQFTGERAERFEEAGLKPTVTIGRFLFKPVDEIIEPGTTAYNNITGVIDILAQIYGDPTVALTKGFSLLSKSAKTFTNLDNLSKAGKLFENTGLLQGTRKTIFGPTSQEFLAGKGGVKFKQFLWENNTSDIIATSKNNIDDYDFYVALDKFKAKNKGKSFDEIDDALTKELVNENLLVKATLNNVPTVKRAGNNMTKMMERTYGTRLVTENKNDSLVSLNRFIRLATSSMDKDAAAKTTNKFMKDSMKALSAADAPSQTAIVVTNFIERNFKPAVIRGLAGVDKDTSVKKAATKLTEWQTELVEQGLSVQARFIGTAKKNKDTVRSYTIDSSGGDLPITNVLRDLQGGNLDGIKELLDPIVASQLADEIFLPDPKALLRSAKALDETLGKVGTKLLASGNVESTRRFMDWYYGALFKPLVLLRPAWTIEL